MNDWYIFLAINILQSVGQIIHEPRFPNTP